MDVFNLCRKAKEILHSSDGTPKKNKIREGEVIGGAKRNRKMPRIGIEPMIFSLRVRRVTTAPSGRLDERVVLFALLI